MKANKVLFITSGMKPFIPETTQSTKGLTMPEAIQSLGYEIRTFSPDWGTINERRNQLHEVIRLSGMNIIINDTDHPLIIKVASIQATRMQIYFIDNEEYFSRKGMAAGPDGKEFTDNGERAIFYARGVLETVKKLRWVPDVIHCYGWVAALAPLFIKKAYEDEPSFSDAKIVFSVTSNEISTDMGPTFLDSIPFKDVTANDIADVCQGNCTYDELMKIAVKFSDGIIIDDQNASQDVIEYAKSVEKPIMQKSEDFNAYSEFYDKLMD